MKFHDASRPSRRFSLAVTLRLGLACAIGGAAPSAVSAQSPAPLAIDSYALPNGLKVILAEDHSAQVVTVNVWYNVGIAERAPPAGPGLPICSNT